MLLILIWLIFLILGLNGSRFTILSQQLMITNMIMSSMLLVTMNGFWSSNIYLTTKLPVLPTSLMSCLKNWAHSLTNSYIKSFAGVLCQVLRHVNGTWLTCILYQNQNHGTVISIIIE